MRRCIESFIAARARAASSPAAMVDAAAMHKQVLVLRLISKYRTLGMFQADLDPLKRAERPYIADLDVQDLRLHRGRPRHRVRRRLVQGRARRRDRMRLRDLIAALQETYCAHARRRVHVHVRHAAEALHPGAPRADPLAAELRARVPQRTSSSGSPPRRRSSATCTPSTSGQKRFSGEGGDTHDPDARPPDPAAGAAGVQEMVIGMAHRGRLNVLVNTLGKMPSDLFAEFEGKHAAGPARGRREVSPGLLVGRRRRRADRCT